MSDILNELQLVKKASQEQTAASQEIAAYHLMSIEKVETASTQAIARAESEFNQSVGELTEYAIAAHKKAIEDASGGRNTILIDAQSNSNVMVWISSFNCEEMNAMILAKHGIDLELGTGVFPAFLKNGTHIPGFWRGKYTASAGANGGCSVMGGVQPRVSVDFDAAKALCENKGAGWHLSSIWEDAAVSLLSAANETIPRGNTNYGRSHENKIETSRRADNGIPGDTSGTGRTDCGKGPVTWSHDGTVFGCFDLVGNVREWLDQMKLNDGQIITTLDNNPDIAEVNWHKHGAYFDSPSDNMEGSGNVGSPILSNTVTKRNGPIDDDSHNYPYMHNASYSAIAKSETYQSLEVLKRLLIETASTSPITGGIWARNYGDRMPLRGGSWGTGSSAGLGALSLSSARSGADSGLGFRPAFFG